MNALQNLFSPASVAIIGASSDAAKLGGRPLHNLLKYGYAGRLYPVHARDAEVQGQRAFRSVLDLPEVPDLAIIVVPAPAVVPAMRDCAAKGVKLVQILSAGFAELGGEGIGMQAEVLHIAREAGMRITGPNALGSVSPGDNFFATFSGLMDSIRLPAGVVGVATQSGAFGSHVYAAAALRGVGISRGLATGNEADIDAAAAIEFMAGDPATQVICAAFEACKDGARLRRALLAAAAAGKPCIVMKVGATDVGAAAAATHTGSLAGSDVIYDTVFRECGALRVDSIEAMIDLAYLCSVGRLPPNGNLGIVTISGGIGVLMADTAVQAGLAVPALDAAQRQQVTDILPYASGINPVDTTAQVAGSLPLFGALFGALIEAGMGTVLPYLAHIGRNPARMPALEAPLAALRQQHPDRLIVVGTTVVPEVRERLEALGIPVFEEPVRAVRAIAGAHRLRELQAAALAMAAEHIPPALPQPLPVNLGDEAAAKAWLGAQGVPVPEERICRHADDAVAAAEAIGFPVVAKILSPDIAHKTEIGGVLLNLGDADAVSAAFATLVARAAMGAPGARIEGVLVAPMLKDGVECIIGLQRDPVFGPMVMVGTGGVAVELFKDVAFASCPLSPARAEALIDRIRGARLLSGWRGGPPLDRAALARALVVVSRLAIQHPAIAGIDINPFLVREKGGAALDALVTVQAVS